MGLVCAWGHMGEPAGHNPPSWGSCSPGDCDLEPLKRDPRDLSPSNVGPGTGAGEPGGLSPRWGELGSYSSRAWAGGSEVVPWLWHRVVPKPPQGLKVPAGAWGAGELLTMGPEGFWGPPVRGKEGFDLETWGT